MYERISDNNFDVVYNLCLKEINQGAEIKEVFSKYFVFGKDRFGSSKKISQEIEVAYFTELVPCLKNAFMGNELSQCGGIIFEGYFNTLKVYGEEYIKNILCREQGSRWKISPSQFFALEWDSVDVPEQISDGNSFYFRCTLPKTITATEEIYLLSQLKDEEVSFREGGHGIELVTSKPVVPKQALRGWAICTVIEDEYFLATAYPGTLTASIKKFPGLSIPELRALKYPFAVKSIA